MKKQTKNTEQTKNKARTIKVVYKEPLSYFTKEQWKMIKELGKEDKKKKRNKNNG